MKNVKMLLRDSNVMNVSSWGLFDRYMNWQCNVLKLELILLRESNIIR